MSEADPINISVNQLLCSLPTIECMWPKTIWSFILVYICTPCTGRTAEEHPGLSAHSLRGLVRVLRPDGHVYTIMSIEATLIQPPAIYTFAAPLHVTVHCKRVIQHNDSRFSVGHHFIMSWVPLFSVLLLSYPLGPTYTLVAPVLQCVADLVYTTLIKFRHHVTMFCSESTWCPAHYLMIQTTCPQTCFTSYMSMWLLNTNSHPGGEGGEGRFGELQTLYLTRMLDHSSRQLPVYLKEVRSYMQREEKTHTHTLSEK